MTETRTVTATLASVPIQTGDTAANLHSIEKVLSGTSSEFVLFPELTLSGFTRDSNRYSEWAERAPDGPSCRALAAFAAKSNTTFCAGFVEADQEGKLYITHAAFGPAGFLGSQRKFFPQSPSKGGPFSSAEALTPIPLFETDAAVLACSDFLLPEPALLAGYSGVSLILSPTDCFGHEQREMLTRLLRARAMDNGIPAVAVFGSDATAPEEEVMAVLAVDRNGDVLISETRPSNASCIRTVELDLGQSRAPWGGPQARRDVFSRAFLAGDTISVPV